MVLACTYGSVEARAFHPQGSSSSLSPKDDGKKMSECFVAGAEAARRRQGTAAVLVSRAARGSRLWTAGTHGGRRWSVS